METKSKETNLRRKLNRMEYRLIKSRIKNPHFNNHGGYQIVNYNNVVIAGMNYDLSLEDVENFVTQWTEKDPTGFK